MSLKKSEPFFKLEDSVIKNINGDTLCLSATELSVSSFDFASSHSTLESLKNNASVLIWNILWKDVESAVDEYNEDLLAKLRLAIKDSQELGFYSIINLQPRDFALFGTDNLEYMKEHFLDALYHTARRLKDCESILGFEHISDFIPMNDSEKIEYSKLVVDKLYKKHPHYIYFSADSALKEVSFPICHSNGDNNSENYSNAVIIK